MVVGGSADSVFNENSVVAFSAGVGAPGVVEIGDSQISDQHMFSFGFIAIFGYGFIRAMI